MCARGRQHPAQSVASPGAGGGSSRGPRPPCSPGSKRRRGPRPGGGSGGPAFLRRPSGSCSALPRCPSSATQGGGAEGSQHRAPCPDPRSLAGPTVPRAGTERGGPSSTLQNSLQSDLLVGLGKPGPRGPSEHGRGAELSPWWGPPRNARLELQLRQLLLP